MFYIEDTNGTHMRDSRDLEVQVETFEECERIINFYFDMRYDFAFTIVNTTTGDRKTITRETYSAWELAQNSWWVGEFRAKVKGGIALYDSATPVVNKPSVVFRRMQYYHRVTRRLVDEQEMELVPITEEQGTP